MVAVKTLWVLWKSFSTNFSFSNNNNNTNNNNNGSSNSNDTKNKGRGSNDTKRVKYNRLRPLAKTTSFHLPSKSSSNTSFNCMNKSSSSYDTNGNKMIKDTSWNYTLDNSDSEFEENRDDVYRMPTTPDDFSDFEDEDEALTCDVCDRSFPSIKRLADHQQKKRHYGCLQCDSIFPSRQALEHHREQMDHYDFVSDYESDTTSFESDEEGFDDDEEERERLL